jgi:hypothetical protein
MATLIDTDIKNNISHIRPYLGILLIGCIALAFGMIIYNAATELAQAVQTSTGMSANHRGEGNISLDTKENVYYGDTITYDTFFSGIPTDSENVQVYINTVCFQDAALVFQTSTREGEPIYLYDQNEKRIEWNGERASCSATLLFREVTKDSVQVGVLNTFDFIVEGRGY